MSASFLDDLYRLLVRRKRDLPEGSYSASLYRRGEDAVLRKIAEEACELLLASKARSRPALVHESADLLFHLLVLLGLHEIPPGEVLEELRRRGRGRSPAPPRPPEEET